MNYDQWKLDTPNSYDNDDIKYIICPNCDWAVIFISMKIMMFL